MNGKIFDIQRFSIYDGPGIRTNVFFKGCNLRCKWCHNPESQLQKAQLMFYAEKCVGCGKCAEVCSNTFTPECIACGKCRTLGKCVFDDEVNEIAQKFEQADGLVLGTPVYYACVNGTLEALCQRLFYSSHFDKTMKVGASVVIARRGGCSATFDALNKFFTISGMPVASSQYWNSVHGGAPGDVNEDEEGLQTVRVLARNMAFLMKSIALGKEKYGLPAKEDHLWTNFIR